LVIVGVTTAITAALVFAGGALAVGDCRRQVEKEEVRTFSDNGQTSRLKLPGTADDDAQRARCGHAAHR
jgi:hypothetical protein